MKFTKIAPNDVELDPRFQRELDEERVADMIAHFDRDRIGVPVVSVRAKGTTIAIDGQHRISALKGAGHGDAPILMETYSGLSVEQEARLFLELNGGRKAVGILDKYKARLVAKDPIALEMQEILAGFKLKIGTGASPKVVNSIDAVESVHVRKQNLGEVMTVLTHWSDGKDQTAFNGQLIRAVAEFLYRFKEAQPLFLAKQLDKVAPARAIDKIKRLTSNMTPKLDAYVDVFLEIYNAGLKRGEKLRAPTKLKRAAAG